MFDVQKEYFRRKTRLVPGGHVIDPPDTITYAGLVYRDTARIALTLDDLNDLRVKVTEIQNAHITDSVTEKIWTVLGPDFGEDDGRMSIVVQALYVFKSAGDAFCNNLADCMHNLGFGIPT